MIKTDGKWVTVSVGPYTCKIESDNVFALKQRGLEAYIRND